MASNSRFANTKNNNSNNHNKDHNKELNHQLQDLQALLLVNPRILLLWLCCCWRNGLGVTCPSLFYNNLQKQLAKMDLNTDY